MSMNKKSVMKTTTKKPVDQIKRPEIHTYFEEYGEQMLIDSGMTKTQFCNKVGITSVSNLPKLFKTKNVVTLRKVSDVLDVPLEVLIDGKRNDDCEKLTIVGCIRVNGRAFMINDVSDLEKLTHDVTHRQK